MSIHITGAGTRTSVIAISPDESGFKAVEVRKHGSTFEVVWARQSENGKSDWSRFAEECGLSSKPAQEQKSGEGKTVVMGFDSRGVAFYRMDVPSAGSKELAAMVRLQAESRLPLPAEHMELAWRAGEMRNGQVTVTMAAGRRESLEEFVEDLEGFRPSRIVLDCEGVVAAWRRFFSEGDRPKKAVVISVEGHNTRVCLAEDGQLGNAVMLDMGEEDFSGAMGSSEGGETVERFLQDVRSVLDMFGCGASEGTPVFVLTDGRREVAEMISSLSSAGLDVRAALPNKTEPGKSSGLRADEIYAYRVPMGLAAMALDGASAGLDIFERLYSPTTRRAKSRWFYSPKLAGAIAAVMLVLLVVVWYVVDVTRPQVIKKRLDESISPAEMKRLMQRGVLLKTVAAERPDILELMTLVNSSGEAGIKLAGLAFKKGQRVRVSGEAPGEDRIFKFQEKLREQKGIREPKIESSSPLPKGGKWKFEISFSYKTFSATKTRRGV
ncbi:MAG: hypothetical protein JSU94_02480 [Phycisphaerales bacterium]|nr:MAG: hypothetical protein JSU94_02480 [Phycisphaerales bacterium]